MSDTNLLYNGIIRSFLDWGLALFLSAPRTSPKLQRLLTKGGAITPEFSWIWVCKGATIHIQLMNTRSVLR